MSTTSNVGPLTTIFTPAESCTSILAYMTLAPDTVFSDRFSSLSLLYISRGVACGSGSPFNPVAPDSACYPSGFTEVNSNWFADASATPVFSPGVLCPSGFTADRGVYRRGDDTGAPTTGLASEYGLKPGELAVGCCPVGYTVNEYQINTCVKKYGNDITHSYDRTVTYGAISAYDFGDAVTCARSTTVYSVPTSIQVDVTAHAVILIVPSTTTFGGAIGAVDGGPLPTTAGHGHAGSGSNNGSSKAGDSHALSTGAKIAISVTIPVVFLTGVAIGMFFLLRYRRRHREAKAKVQIPTQQRQNCMSETPNNHPSTGGFGLGAEKQELPAQAPPPAELASNTQSTTAYFELPTWMPQSAVAAPAMTYSDSFAPGGDSGAHPVELASGEAAANQRMAELSVRRAEIEAELEANSARIAAVEQSGQR